MPAGASSRKLGAHPDGGGAAELAEVAGRVLAALGPQDLHVELADAPDPVATAQLVVVARDDLVDRVGRALEELVARVVDEDLRVVALDVGPVDVEEVVLPQAVDREAVDELEDRLGSVEDVGVLAV